MLYLFQQIMSGHKQKTCFFERRDKFNKFNERVGDENLLPEIRH